MNDVKNLNQKIIERDDFLKEKERKIEELTGKLTGEEVFEEKAGIMLQEKKDLITINVGLNSEIEKLEKEFKNLKNEVKKSKKQITIHIGTITDLKLDAKTLKSKISSVDEEKEKLKEQSLDLKKEVKVLRRERDHYKKIVKENNLL
jgi:chromosome segregation ATPase